MAAPFWEREEEGDEKESVSNLIALGKMVNCWRAGEQVNEGINYLNIVAHLAVHCFLLFFLYADHHIVYLPDDFSVHPKFP